MRPKNAGLLGLIFCSLFLLSSCLGSPTLDTTSSASYKQSLQKMYEAQKDEPARLLLANSISSVVTGGKEYSLENSNKSSDFYDILATIGGAGRLMPLNGKTADEIIALGQGARKKWVTDNIPPEIASVQQEIAKLNEKKLHTENIASTEKVFQLENVTLTPQQTLESGTNKPLNGVSKFIITGQGINKGSVPVYGCEIIITITDTKDTAILYDAQTLNISFSTPVPPNGTQDFRREISVWDWSSTPYGINRYSLQYTLKSANASSKGGLSWGSELFTAYDETKLANLEKELAELTELLKQFNN